MAATSRPQLGELERAVMEYLWTQEAPHPEGASVREVHDSIGQERQLAYTTVMTVLDRLSKKELVTRERDGRAWRYKAAATRDELTSDVLHDTLGELAGEDRRAALLHFLDRSTPQELDELRQALADLEERQSTGAATPGRRWSRKT